MKKIIMVAVMAAGTVVGADDAAIQRAVEKSVSKASLSSAVAESSGIVVSPTVGGAAVTADVWTFKDSVKKVGFLKTMAQVPVQFPKTFTAGAVIAAAIPIIANNPKLLGLEKKQESAGSADPTANPSDNHGIIVNANGNNNSVITVTVKTIAKE